MAAATAHQSMTPTFPLLERGRAGRYAQVLVLTLAVMAGAIAALNFVVDPFQQYRKPAWYEARFYRPLQRYVNPGMAKHYDFDTVITGSSMMENYRNAEAGKILNGKVINLAIGAMTAYELRHLLTTVLAAPKARHVIFDLNFNAFAGSPTMQVVAEPLPLYLYDDVPWNDVHYVLQAQTLARSMEIVFGTKRGRYSTNADQPWYWGDEYEFSKGATLRGLDLADINREFRQPPRTLEGMRASFAANVLPLMRAHPEIRFSLVYPPWSALVWEDFRQRNQIDVSLAFKRSVFDTVRDLPNVALYDFQARLDWVNNLDNYKDIYHFSPRISREMIEAIASGKDRVTPETLPLFEATVRKLGLATIQAP
jgi:hypothetical protein